MFDFDDIDLEREAEELRDNYNLEDSFRLEEHINSRIDNLEFENNAFNEFFDTCRYYDVLYRISKLRQLRDNLYRWF